MTADDHSSRGWATGRRLEGLLLRGSRRDSPAAVVADLTAIQAQEHGYARWSVAQRCSSGVDLASAVDAAFDNGSILRTHVLRPTWHYVAPADLRWLTKLSRPRLLAASARPFSTAGLDPETLTRSADLIAASVADGPRTRHELAGDLAHAGIPVEGPRLVHMLMHAEISAITTSGPMRGKQHTYSAFDERVPSDEGPDGDEALALLAWRYFSTRGPATLRDFGWWAGLGAGDARKGLEAVRSRLDQRDSDGRTYWLVDENQPAPSPSGVDLIQCYDELIISFSESRDVLRTDDVFFKTPLNIDGYRHVLVLDGRLIGHWRVAPGRRPVVETRLAKRLDRDEEGLLSRAVDAYLHFAG